MLFIVRPFLVPLDFLLSSEELVSQKAAGNAVAIKQCHDCIDRTQRLCRGCCGGYCLVHNEGSTSTFCDCSIPATSLTRSDR
ncbi:hypothetical protein CABS01_06978 [Colletotrichum abscissum]|uniref:uncharacterized protein n=1 Tax=Colletotrichum abscissum TaxID=1671311 RepID=UPI0027D74F71|nr:uncharacterized protein CABS01_06978 [Colletotrichum abscissum]KAK1513572.1 hypothetical protein CABS01_06978 [Colletotrichum abscissum]